VFWQPVTLEQLALGGFNGPSGVIGSTAHHRTVRSTRRVCTGCRVESAHLNNGDQRARRLGQVFAVFTRNPENDTVGPTESDLNFVFASAARCVDLGRVELLVSADL